MAICGRHVSQSGLYWDPLGCHPWGQSLLGQATWSLDACQLQDFCQPDGNCTIYHCICFKSLNWSTSHSSNGIWWTYTSWPTTTHQKRRRLLALAVQQTAGRETHLPVLSIRLAETISGPVRRRWRTRRIKPRKKLRPRVLRLWKKAHLHLCWACHMAPQWLTAWMAAWSLYTGNMRATLCKQVRPHWARRNQWSWQIIKTRFFQGHLRKAQITGPFRTRIPKVALSIVKYLSTLRTSTTWRIS